MPKLDFVKKELIEKGWSGDIKYCATTADGSKFLLRITSLEKAEQTKQLFDLQQQVAALGISMSKPVEMYAAADGIYTVYTWVEGQDAEAVVPFLPKAEQYELGLQAGEILRQIHSLPAPANQPDWQQRFNAKASKKIEQYDNCPIKFDRAEHLIAYIEANRHLLANRPQSFQHGDYHIGNMMVEEGKIVIIDFDRYDFGDPWEEFNRIVWSAQAAPAFASGLGDGYFDKEVPMAFWRLLALYISSNMLSSVPWAIPFGEKEVQTMLRQAAEVLGWYDNMQRIVPTWYS
ncbi:MAG: phosphotransferase [Firmicutes bacterium]|nr:phosphotransferase [Bacillota bacterium]